MKQKSLTLLLTTFLISIGVEAGVIPSSFYSEPTEGAYYIYNVNEGKFLKTAGVNENSNGLLNTPELVTLTSAEGAACKGGGQYVFSGNAERFTKIGYWGGQWIWSDAEAGNGDILAWTFNSNGENTYTLSVTLDETFSQNSSTLTAGTYYMKNSTNLGNEAEAGTYAFITETDYYRYLATTTATLPSEYYTKTPTAGTYYLYNIERNGFLYRGGNGNYAGLKATPATLVITSDGDGNFYIKFSDGKYLKTGEYQGYYVWTDATDESFAWTFEPFHGVPGLFLVKCPLNGTDRYLYSTGFDGRSVNGWTTPDANRTQYAWALISEDNYYEWQNSFILSDENEIGFSATNDIYNVNPTVVRAMTAGIWNTLVVPFNMPIPPGWTVKEPIAFDGNTLTFGDAYSIIAGKPYIVKPTEAVADFSATNVTIMNDLAPTTVGNLTMTGTYTYMDAVPQDSYVLGNDNKLYRVNSTVNLKPFRAYFTIADATETNIRINFDGEPTAINSVDVPATDNIYHNIAGHRVAAPTKGLYIVNGKKIFIK